MDTDPTSDVRQARVNRLAYDKLRDELEQQSLGMFVRMRDGEVDRAFEDLGDAYEAGCIKFGEREFSVIKVGEVVDFGALNHLVA